VQSVLVLARYGRRKGVAQNTEMLKDAGGQHESLGHNHSHEEREHQETWSNDA
jgi:hypothetical protein